MIGQLTQEGTLTINPKMKRRAGMLRLFLALEADKADPETAAKLRAAAWILWAVENTRMMPREDAYFCPHCQTPMVLEMATLKCPGCDKTVWMHNQEVALKLRGYAGQYFYNHGYMPFVLERAADVIDTLAL